MHRSPILRQRQRALRLAAMLGTVAASAGFAVAQTENSTGNAFTNIPALPGSVAMAPVVIFFPPIPPPLDRPTPRGVIQPSRFPPPPELAKYVGEFFYPQLSSRLASREKFPAKLRQQLDAYLTAKTATQQELRSELAKLKELDSAARLTAVEALARRQAPTLAALERDSEQLRRDLIESGHDWSDLREWHLSDKQSRGFSPLEIAQVMRAYAYYHSALLPAQRRLLIEIALELSAAAEDSTRAARAQPYLFLPPEPARVLLPTNLPDDVADAVAAYQTKKSALKKELYDTVTAVDGGSFNALRGGLRTLAARQAPLFGELEKLADAMRRGLARLPLASQPSERSPLSPELSVRIATFVRDRDANQAEATGQIEALAAKNFPMRIGYEFEETGLKFTVVPPRAGRERGGSPPPDSLANLNAALGRIADDFARKLSALTAERDEINRETAAYLGTTDRARVTAALNLAARVVQQQEKSDAFSDYRMAMFEPGLVLGQRILLFDSALQRLELPLPRGELQPSRRAASW